MMLDGRAEISRPGAEAVSIDGVTVAAGARVILRPKTTATDVLMRSVDGRRGIVEAVVQDTEDRIQLAVALEDDPVRSLGKGRGLGHRFFLAPDELEPIAGERAHEAPQRVLVAGIGNVFMGDDGFGVAVADALSKRRTPEGVDVVDFGIRGMDLAYALGDGYDAAVLVDVAPRGRPPGTLTVIEPQIDPDLFVGFEAHRMDPVTVLQFARQFAPLPRRMLILACEPQTVLDPDDEELLDELSAPVAAAVAKAVQMIEELLVSLLDAPVRTTEGVNR